MQFMRTEPLMSLSENGYVLFENFIDHKLTEWMCADLKKSYLTCQKARHKNGVDDSAGTLHHLIGQGESFMACLSEFQKLDFCLNEYFQGEYILNSFGGNVLESGVSYANRIHRDQRSFSGDLPLMLNTIVMLDDFTSDNGATWLMNRGHEKSKIPTHKEFSSKAFQIVAPAGSVVIFNSNLWHKAGSNNTKKPRRSVTPMFSKPFIKPQFDYPRALGYNTGNSYTDYLRQVLGYKSRIPSNLSEWYQPKEKRYYRSDQG